MSEDVKCRNSPIILSNSFEDVERCVAVAYQATGHDVLLDAWTCKMRLNLCEYRVQVFEEVIGVCKETSPMQFHTGQISYATVHGSQEHMQVLVLYSSKVFLKKKRSKCSSVLKKIKHSKCVYST